MPAAAGMGVAVQLAFTRRFTGNFFFNGYFDYHSRPDMMTLTNSAAGRSIHRNGPGSSAKPVAESSSGTTRRLVNSRSFATSSSKDEDIK